MHVLAVFLLSLQAAFVAGQANIALLIPRDSFKRSDILAGGGWALVISSPATCPAGTTACGNTSCCPNSLVCNSNLSGFLADGASCCPDSTDCNTPLATTPYCADDSWALWANDEGSPYFCCLQGQIGLQTGECVSGKQVVASSLTATFVGVSVTSGAVFQTGSATKSGAATAAGSSQSKITQAPTTTLSGGSIESSIKSAVSSAASAAVHNGARQNGAGGIAWEGFLGAAIFALI